MKPADYLRNNPAQRMTIDGQTDLIAYASALAQETTILANSFVYTACTDANECM